MIIMRSTKIDEIRTTSVFNTTPISTVQVCENPGCKMLCEFSCNLPGVSRIDVYCALNLIKKKNDNINGSDNNSTPSNNNNNRVSAGKS